MTRTRRSPLPALAATLAIVLAGCGASGAASQSAGGPTASASPSESSSASLGASPSASEAASEVRVRIKNSKYDPAELTIGAGTEVTFLNADAFTHTVTEGADGVAVADPIVDEDIERGGSVHVTFDEPGTYTITCKIHSSMLITITVEG